MAVKNDLELDLENQEQDDPSLIKKRITKLSSDVKSLAQERDEKDALLKQKETEFSNTSRERDFYKDFSKVSGTYSNASKYEEEIKAKVLAGYSVKDATVSVLDDKGELTPKPQERESVAGGSATNPPSKSGQKEIKDMTQSERRSALLEAEARGDFGTN